MPSAPRLRFDKVATRVVDRLHASLKPRVPAGTTVAVTLTAPIRLASKTTEALDDQITAMLARPSRAADVVATIHANRVRIRLIAAASPRAPKLIGFVHNPDTSAVLFLDAAEELLKNGAAGDSRTVVRAVQQALTSR